MAYLTNNQRLDLHLIGHCDVPVSVIQTAIGEGGTYYVEGVKPLPPKAPATTGGGGGTTPSAKAARR